VHVCTGVLFCFDVYIDSALGSCFSTSAIESGAEIEMLPQNVLSIGKKLSSNFEIGLGSFSKDVS